MVACVLWCLGRVCYLSRSIAPVEKDCSHSKAWLTAAARSEWKTILAQALVASSLNPKP